LTPRLPDRRLLTLFIALFAAVVPLQRAHAQAPPAPVVVDVDTSRYPEVSVTLDVQDAQGGASSSVTVMEAGKRRPAKLDGAGHGRLEVVLVVDTSGSMAGAPLAAAKAAVQAFVSQLPPGASVAIVGFGAKPYVVSPMTSDPTALGTAISKLRAQGETALYDGLALAADQFTAAPVPRSLVLVSDGGDTASSATLEAINAKLVAGRMRLFAVQLVTAETNRALLDGLTTTTKGRTVEAGDAAALQATYSSIAADAVSQVRVTYESRAHGEAAVDIQLGDAAAKLAVTTTIGLPAAPATATPSEPAPGPVAPETRGDRWLPLAIGGLAFFLALLALSWLVLVRQPRSLLATASRSGRSVDFGEMKGKAGEIFERSLERRGRRAALGVRLENAGVALRPGEYAVMVATLAGCFAMLGLMFGGLVAAIAFAGLVLLGARLLLGSRAKGRRNDLEEQLPEFLQQVTSSLRAGYGVMQAIDAVSREMEAPMSDELRRLVTEVQLGRDFGESLDAMARRVGGTDFSWVVQAIEINRDVGGELVEVLEAVGDTIRARAHLERQVKTLTAQGRLSSRILLAMPFAMAGILSVLSPGYLAPFVEHRAGPMLLAIGGVLVFIGRVWLRAIVRPRF